MRRKPCTEIKSKFDVLNLKSAFSIFSMRQINFWLCKNCSKIQELENRRYLYSPAFDSFY